MAKTSKADLRKELLSGRDGLAVQDIQLRSVEIADLFMKSIPYQEHSIISAYWPIGNEVDTRAIVELLVKQGLNASLPAIIERRQPLGFRTWLPGDEMKPGPHGTMEPVSGQVVQPSLFLIPLLGFNRAGDRLGYGAGYYDITLRAARQDRQILAVGLAFSLQERHDLKAEPHDEELDWVVTEREAIQIR